MAKPATKTAPRRRDATKAPAVEPNAPITRTPMLVNLDTLVPYEKNPRDNSAAIDAVAASIKEFGFLIPIVVDSNNVIVAGHTRYAASVSLGLTQVPVLVADHLDERQVNAFRLVDNKTAELATWDFDLLAGEVQELMNSGIDLVPFGWSQSEVDCLADLVGSSVLNDVLDDDMKATDDETDGLVNRHDRGGGDGVNSAKQANKGANVVSKDPTSVRVAVGEINFFVPIEFYRNWAHEVRKANGFDMQRIVDDLAGRLGLEARRLARSTKQQEADKLAADQAMAEEAQKSGRSRTEVRREATVTRRRPRTAEATIREAVDAAEA